MTRRTKNKAIGSAVLLSVLIGGGVIYRTHRQAAYCAEGKTVFPSPIDAAYVVTHTEKICDYPVETISLQSKNDERHRVAVLIYTPSLDIRQETTFPPKIRWLNSHSLEVDVGFVASVRRRMESLDGVNILYRIKLVEEVSGSP